MSEKTSVADPRAVTRDIFSATLGSIACCYTGQVRWSMAILGMVKKNLGV